MADIAKIQAGDIGIQFLITVMNESGVQDLTGALSVNLYFQTPNRTMMQRACTIVNPTQGIVKYTSVAGDFDQAGHWKIQVIVQFSASNIKHSDINTISVNKNLI